MAGLAQAGSVQFSTYYPAPFGVYDRLRLPPRAALTDEPCDAGTFYYETGAGLRFCDQTTLTWGGLGGGVWTQSGNNIYPADTASNPNLMVGIGTTAPTQRLHVANGDILLDDHYSIQWGGGSTGIEGENPNNKLHFTTNNIERMIIDNNGNVGIGTTSPTDTLTVNGTFGTTGNAFIDGNLNINAVPHNDSGVSLYAWSNTNAQGIFQGPGDVDNYAVISLMTDAAAGNQAWQMRHGKRAEVLNKFNIAYRDAAGAWSYPMTIDTAGNVGIGTTNPGNYSISVEKTGDASLKLVADSDNNNNGDNPIIFMTQDGGGNAFLIGMVGTAGSDPLESLYTGTTPNAMFIGDPGGGGVTGDLQFGTNNAIRMTIDGSIGNVGIGTTAPQRPLHLNNPLNDDTYLRIDSGSTLNAAQIEFTRGSDLFTEHSWIGPAYDATDGKSFDIWTNESIPMLFGINDDEKMRIDPSGNVGIWTVNPTEKLEVNGNVKAASFLYSSDERLKKDITTLSGSLEKILNLRGIQFKWKNGDDNENIGFIAQEVEKVAPQVVRSGSDGSKSVEYGNIVPLLVEAMKEQQAQIDELKTQIKELQTK